MSEVMDVGVLHCIAVLGVGEGGRGRIAGGGSRLSRSQGKRRFRRWEMAKAVERSIGDQDKKKIQKLDHGLLKSGRTLVVQEWILVIQYVLL